MFNTRVARPSQPRVCIMFPMKTNVSIMMANFVHPAPDNHAKQQAGKKLPISNQPTNYNKHINFYECKLFFSARGISRRGVYIACKYNPLAPSSSFNCHVNTEPAAPHRAPASSVVNEVHLSVCRPPTLFLFLSEFGRAVVFLFFGERNNNDR